MKLVVEIEITDSVSDTGDYEGEVAYILEQVEQMLLEEDDGPLEATDGTNAGRANWKYDDDSISYSSEEEDDES